eukprot:TRINITY_DN2377_c0_g1_i2.p1 TRINITY_DN2377_c0_g1~~TRINITY_DN2377_c0_g1_i2.p1  ORF type:complete len:399 (-),score=110.30 TRINITY_DN2377_c0_g1_i2:28-1224(-)
MISAATDSERSDWIGAIQTSINTLKGITPDATQSTTEPAPVEPEAQNNEFAAADENTNESTVPPAGSEVPSSDVVEDQSNTTTATATTTSSTSLLDNLYQAKEVIPFMQWKDNKVIEFWEIWLESIPRITDLSPMDTISYTICASADMDRISWRISGSQNRFIQKMVDFFWNVGAPEDEIGRLNSVGASVNPVEIGSWIDMSSKGGMDGGWIFPGTIPYASALLACDESATKQILTKLGEENNLEIILMGRDMGAAPPRQTHMIFKVPGNTFDEQIQYAIETLDSFGIPQIPENALTIMREAPVPGLLMNVVSSYEGFVKVGVMVPNPTENIVNKLCCLTPGGNYDVLQKLQSSLGTSPSYTEYLYLAQGFGYGVYKEGFDIVFHYDVGTESGTNDSV